MLRGDASPLGEVAYVEEGRQLGPSRGSARILEEVPGRVEVEVETDAPAVVVLADGWYEGWQARVNGEPARVLLADYALQVVEVPAGTSQVLFEYRPTALRDGLRLSGAAALGLPGGRAEWPGFSVREAAPT